MLITIPLGWPLLIGTKVLEDPQIFQSNQPSSFDIWITLVYFLFAVILISVIADKYR